MLIVRNKDYSEDADEGEKASFYCMTALKSQGASEVSNKVPGFLGRRY